MGNRRSLTEGIKLPVDSQVERAFVFQEKAADRPKQTTAAPAISRSPLSARIRTDLASGLKRASLERQLNAIAPNTMQDILEEAIEFWLKANGYLA